MVKKSLLMIFVALMIIPMVSASIVITSPMRSIYNIGDDVSISGYVLAEQAADDKLEVILLCDYGSETNSLQLVMAEGQKVSFSALGINNFVLEEAGDCKIKVEYAGDSEATDKFTVSDSLEAIFSLNQDEFQLGDTFVFRGTVFTFEGKDVDSGVAKVYLKDPEDDTFLFAETEINGGSFSVSKRLENLERGEYFIEIYVEDEVGNKGTYEDVIEFEIDDEIRLTVDTDKNSYLPGETIKIGGDVETITESIDDAVVEIKFIGEEHTTGVVNDKFSYEFEIPDDIKSDGYTFLVKVNDPDGNFGYADLTLFIEQKPDDIENMLENIEIDPGDTLNVVVGVYDQTGEWMSADVDVKIVNPEGEIEYSNVVSTTDDIEIFISKYSLPGTYMFTSSVEDIEKDSSFIVNENEEASSRYGNQKVYITNEGNVDYEDVIEIIMTNDAGKEYVVRKVVKIEPEGEVEIDLTEEVPPGQYNVEVGEGTEEGNEITGYAVYEEGEADYLGQVNLDEDNRPFTKKVEQGMSSITGASQIETTKTNPVPYVMFGLFLLIVCGLLGVYVYNRREELQEWWDEMTIDEDDKKNFLKNVKYNEPFNPVKKEEVKRVGVDKLNLEDEKFNPNKVKKPVIKNDMLKGDKFDF